MSIFVAVVAVIAPVVVTVATVIAITSLFLLFAPFSILLEDLLGHLFLCLNFLLFFGFGPTGFSLGEKVLDENLDSLGAFVLGILLVKFHKLFETRENTCDCLLEL